MAIRQFVQVWLNASNAFQKAAVVKQAVHKMFSSISTFGNQNSKG